MIFKTFKASLLVFLHINGALGHEFYVAVDGSDKLDGTSPEVSEGTTKGPWKTLLHAISEIRKQRPSNPGPDNQATINVLTGIHYQSETLKLTKRDSYLTIQAFNNELPVTISGGQPLNPLNGWKMDGQIRSARFPLSSCGEIFMGKNRLLPARSPNVDWGFNMNVASGDYHSITDLLIETDTCQKPEIRSTQTCPEFNREGFYFEDEFSSDWEDLDQTRVLLFHAWIAEYANIREIVEEEDGRKRVMFQEPLGHAPIGQYAAAGGWRFLIFNNRALLDSPGESVCVEKDGEVEVSYIPLDENSDEIPVMAQLEIIFNIVSNNIHISGLQFQHSNSGGADGYNFGQQSAVRILRAHDITVTNCEFSHTGMTGLFFAHSNRSTAENNVFFDIGYNGIMTQDEKEDTMIANNYFDGCGISHYFQPACIWASGDKNVSVINNEITNVPNHGIRVAGKPHSSDYWEQKGITDPTRDDYIFHIEFNHVHDYGLGIQSDFGGIYLAASRKCEDLPIEEVLAKCYTYKHVFNNLIHDVHVYHYGGTLIYTDAASCMNTVENNLLIGSADKGNYLYHHCGLDNVSKNNIIHRNSTSSTTNQMWGGCEKGRTTSYQQFNNHNNIYIIENTENLSMGKSWDRYWSLEYDGYFDSAPKFWENIYWSQDTSIINEEIFPGEKNWNEWIQGNDTDSLWTDPLFVDLENGDYTLKPESPALKMGFNQIIQGNFGVQQKLKYFNSLKIEN